ncbi:MAG TPA: RDD family protein [Steroidobacteraceae bacterium]|nr:RDD family protein [Steroidobacteraceae bacterium]
MNTPSDQSNRYAAPQAEVQDVDDDHEVGQLAGRGERLGAILLDGLIWGLMTYVPLSIGMGIQGWESIATSTKPGNPFSVYGAMFKQLTGTAGILTIVGFLIVAGLNLYFVAKNSQTLGKKLVGIKVVRTSGSRATLGRIFWLRNVVNALPSFIPFIGGIYGLVDALFIFGEQRRCVHDYIADTIVVKA